MRESSFSKSAHHASCRIRAKSASCTKIRTKSVKNPSHILNKSMQAQKSRATFRMPSRTSFA